jgi:hypothetical protein
LDSNAARLTLGAIAELSGATVTNQPRGSARLETLLFERPAHGVEERGPIERLGEKVAELRKFTATGRQFLGMAGHEENGDRGLKPTDSFGEFDTRHPGHDDVGYQQVDGSLFRFAHGKSLRGLRDLEHVVSGRAEESSCDRAHLIVIFDEKDSLARRRSNTRSCRRAWRRFGVA